VRSVARTSQGIFRWGGVPRVPSISRLRSGLEGEVRREMVTAQDSIFWRREPRKDSARLAAEKKFVFGCMGESRNLDGSSSTSGNQQRGNPSERRWTRPAEGPLTRTPGGGRGVDCNGKSSPPLRTFSENG
jgi:hypothetical protein